MKSDFFDNFDDHTLLPVARTGFSAFSQEAAEEGLRFTRDLIPRPEAVFYARIRGDGLREEGIRDGDIAVIDRSLDPSEGKWVMAIEEGAFALRKFSGKNRREFEVWGTVRLIIREMV